MFILFMLQVHISVSLTIHPGILTPVDSFAHLNSAYYRLKVMKYVHCYSVLITMS